MAKLTCKDCAFFDSYDGENNIRDFYGACCHSPPDSPKTHKFNLKNSDDTVSFESLRPVTASFHPACYGFRDKYE